MALRKLLNTKPDTPYSRPAPLHVSVVATSELTKVLSWAFDENGQARPLVSKKNITAVISDGISVTKVLLFESNGSKLNVGQGYVMRGYTLRGNNPPYSINITKDTVFFQSAPVEVSEALKEEAKKILNPPSKVVPIPDAMETEGFITVHGEVVESSITRKVHVGRDPVPLRTITLKEGEASVAVNLWREAAMWNFDIGVQIRLTHMRGSMSAYGFRLQSTVYSALEDTTSTLTVNALGAAEYTGKPGVLQFLIKEGDSVFDIDEALWLPLKSKLKKLPFPVKIVVCGKKVVQAEPIEMEMPEPV